MKKAAVIALATLIAAVSAYSQETGSTVQGSHYELIYDSGDADGQLQLKELELRFDVYNRLFRFSGGEKHSLLRVRSFSDKDAYDAYVSARLGTPRNGAIYLHYNQAERRELIVHRGSPEEGRMLSHQAFIQYLRAFVPYPPTWMREGFAIYFSTLSFDKESEQLKYEENLSWLETVKKNPEINPEGVLRADLDGIPANFQANSWALVSFFLSSGTGDYLRTLYECFMHLSPTASAAENSELVLGHILDWCGMESLGKDMASYFGSRKTFAELLEEGKRSYAAKDPVMAELYFLGAADLKPSDYAPYYYLGLLAYEEKNFSMAETYYRLALDCGADEALVNYALGLNSASAGRADEAIGYLNKAAEASPERYKDRAEELTAKLRNLKL
ncbi:hypothetical protein LJC14_07025 [Treponema sp. OttesenSCG-928-L16]|nr:hypothetical protein [Treponema sp. OttesenSCG-928-L16]